jgi:hypothetical protein
MANFDFAESSSFPDGVTDFIDHIEGGPFAGFVDQQYLSVQEVIPACEGVNRPCVHGTKVDKLGFS